MTELLTHFESELELVKNGLLSVATEALPEVTPDLEIADLGYSSVQTLELLAYLEETAAISLPPRSLIGVETVADLVAKVHQAVVETTASRI
ncbi:acyl carrier protein [Mycobacterium vicinigordonae]|uniref:Acyl carrier protein n=1 Tax=Mycobacterium vicinigordonae TaxID=1719132 RepID=A0A7D6E7G9_9MYCO|nr:acyl carrier protein [Mycobacterium vicinigordonae]QLL08543.1 acyl carrier protein [Mycobacterium vicinigordonae]